MDKDNKEDFSFGRSCDLEVPVTFRMSVPFAFFCMLYIDSKVDLNSKACVTHVLSQSLSRKQNYTSTASNHRTSGYLVF